MKKWNLIFDVALCTGCRNCVLAVKDEYVDNNFPGYSAPMPRHGGAWVDIRSRERGRFPAVDVAYLFHSCQHCDDPPCMKAAENNAVTRRTDGIVIIDPVRAKGQRQIAEACPYEAVHWNEELSLPQHWNFDAHLIDADWAEPRPVQACPTGALRALKVEDDQMHRMIEAEGLQALDGTAAGRTRVHYRNLARHSHAFVAGTIVGIEGGLEACVRDARIRLVRDGETIATMASDAFGDFRFDGLPRASGVYRIEVTGDGYREEVVSFMLDDACWLGEIRLQPGHIGEGAPR